jgi:hypothetical protein
MTTDTEMRTSIGQHEWQNATEKVAGYFIPQPLEAVSLRSNGLQADAQGQELSTRSQSHEVLCNCTGRASFLTMLMHAHNRKRPPL